MVKKRDQKQDRQVRKNRTIQDDTFKTKIASKTCNGI